MMTERTIKEVCRGGEGPDGIVSLDGLRGMKPAGAKPGDGRVVWDDDLEAIARYALAAAREERVMVILYARTTTSQASPQEIARAIQRWVERQIGWPMQGDLRMTLEGFAGRRVASALVLGNLRIVEIAGATTAAHVAEARIYNEVRRRWLPGSLSVEAYRRAGRARTASA